jgi:predicted permease
MIFHDLTTAVRALVRRRTFSVTAILTLALGIVVATAVFSAVNALLLHPFPFANGDRLYLIARRYDNGHLSATQDAHTVENWQGTARSFERIAMLRDGVGGVLTTPERTVMTPGTAVSPGLFRALGVRPLLGRGFLPADTIIGAPRVLLLGENFWRREFGGEPGVIGQHLTLNDTAYAVVGVIPRSVARMHRYQDVALWLPITSQEHAGLASVSVVGLLRRGTTATEADQELALLARNAIPPELRPYYAHRPVPELVRPGALGDPRFTRGLWLLFGASVLVALIAAGNVASLQMVSLAGRRTELSVRLALGAGRGRVFRQLLVESLVLAGLGGGLGILLSAIAVHATALLRPAGLDQLAAVHLGNRAIEFGAFLTVVTTLAFGLGPCWFAARGLPGGSLQAPRGAGGPVRGHRIQAAMAVAQIALSVVLLLAGGLLVRSLQRMFAVDPGYQPAGLLRIALNPPPWLYGDSASRASYWTTVVARARAVPGVAHVTPANGAMLGDQAYYQTGPVEVAEGPNAGIPTKAAFTELMITSEYFQTLGMRMVAGTAFTAADYQGKTNSVIVDQSLASLLWPGDDAVGKRFRMSKPSSAPWLTVRGVAPAIGLTGIAKATLMRVYEPVPLDKLRSIQGLYIRVRSGADEHAVLRAIQLAVRTVDPGVPVTQAATETELLYGSIQVPRYTTILLGVFAVLATTLAGVGLYGVVAQSVAARTNEIGIRSALGATPDRLMRWVFSASGWLCAAGIGFGIVVALAGRHAIAGLLFGISPFDPIIFVAVPVLVVLVVAGATYVPARRAARLDPAETLRVQ